MVCGKGWVNTPNLALPRERERGQIEACGGEIATALRACNDRDE